MSALSESKLDTMLAAICDVNSEIAQFVFRLDPDTLDAVKTIARSECEKESKGKTPIEYARGM